MKLRTRILLLSFALTLPANAFGGILGMERLHLDFTNSKSLTSRVSWSKPSKIGVTSKGLGWDGGPKTSYDGWILTGPLAVGVSWRPARSVGLTVSLAPAPKVVSLPNGQSYTPYGGSVYVRYSPDRKFWTNWQSLSRGKVKSNKLEFRGVISVPRQASAHYQKLLSTYMRRKDVPWSSDEEALVRSIIKRDRDYFRKHKPFVGYVQVLWEGSFYGSRRVTALTVRAAYSVSGLHIPPKDNRVYKRRSGTWRFVHPSVR